LLGYSYVNAFLQFSLECVHIAFTLDFWSFILMISSCSLFRSIFIFSQFALLYNVYVPWFLDGFRWVDIYFSKDYVMVWESR
jgi:hypothetical protein